MEQHENRKAFLLGIAAFLVVALLGCLLGIGAPEKKQEPLPEPDAPAPAVSESRPPAASALPLEPASEPEPEPLPPPPAAFTFSAAELLEQLSTGLNWNFQYHGEFTHEGVDVTWMAVYGFSTRDNSELRLRVAAYTQTEGGPVEAIQLYGDIGAFQSDDGTENCKTLACQICLEDEAVGGENAYLSTNWNAEEELYTLWTAGSELTPERIEQIPWSAASAVGRDTELRSKLQNMNISYRYPELVELLTAAVPEEERAKDPFLTEALELVQYGAQLEARCVVDSTIPTDPVIYYQGVTKITDEINFVPRIAARNIGAIAGFYDNNDTPFTTVEIRDENGYAYDTCEANDITPLSRGRYLKSNGNLLVGEYPFKKITAMDAPGIRFAGKTQPRMHDHAFTEQEIQACRVLYELDQLEERIHNNTFRYLAFT